jgi:hypothetical protein
VRWCSASTKSRKSRRWIEPSRCCRCGRGKPSDNASSHKIRLIRDWFAKRPRWHTHFTPTSASWINQVERFFALLGAQQIKRGAHRSTKELEAAIAAHIDARNADPKPFRWTKTADDILASIERFCRRTLAVQAQCG